MDERSAHGMNGSIAVGSSVFVDLFGCVPMMNENRFHAIFQMRVYFTKR